MASNAQKNKQDEINKRKVSVAEYSKRFVPLKKAQSYNKKGDIPRAVEQHLTYLRILANYYNVDPEDIGPKLFPGEKDKAELMAIGQVYWDLAKAYDRNPKLKAKALKHLSQFVRFTVGNKWQHLNADLLRKYINKRQSYNLDAFKAAYKEIRVNSKKCYIATLCFGEDHQVTQELRAFKSIIINYSAGEQFVEAYYRISPLVVEYCEQHFIANLCLKAVLKPIIYSFAKIIKKFILSK